MNLSDFNLALKELFRFLENYEYQLLKHELLNDNEVKLTYANYELGKEILISLCDSPNTQRLFIVIAIIRIPYKDVHDYVSFEIYLTKNNIPHPEPLEGNQKDVTKVNSYINTYASLLQTYGAELINSSRQFSHFFPETS